MMRDEPSSGDVRGGLKCFCNDDNGVFHFELQLTEFRPGPTFHVQTYDHSDRSNMLCALQWVDAMDGDQVVNEVYGVQGDCVMSWPRDKSMTRGAWSGAR